MTDLDERYPDLLEDHHDTTARLVVGALDASLRPEVPLASREQIAHALRAEAHRRAADRSTAWRRRLPRTRRTALLLAGLILAVLAAGAAYAYSSLVDQAYKYAPSLESVMKRFSHPLNVSAHACGYTLTVMQAYADATQVTIGYTLGGPPTRHFVALSTDWAQVTDGRGARLKPLTGGLSRFVVNGTEGQFESFDARGVVQGAKNLALRMTFPRPSMVEKMDGVQPGAVLCERYQAAGDYHGKGFSGPVRLVTVRKPLSVSFSVPLDPAARTADLHQTVTAGGMALTLRRLVVTRTEARVYLERASPGHILENLDLQLQIGKRRYGSGAPLFDDWWVRTAPADRLYDFWFAGPFYDYHGPWTLTVRPRAGVQTAGWRTIKGGLWVFHFDVP